MKLPIRLLLMALLFATAGKALAKVHYINKGVTYHIGDNRYSRSADKEFVGTYPVVGQEWIQAFQVSEDDQVWVKIDIVRGVDDCPYCKIIISIDDYDMGRLFQENNGRQFFTPRPLSKKVKRGKTYMLKIASYGDSRVDDFVIADVMVETVRADVIFMKPGPILKMPDEPMPEFTDQPVYVEEAPNTCPGVSVKQRWALGKGQSKDTLKLSEGSDAFADKDGLGVLRAGEAVEFYMKVGKVAGGGDAVSHAMEFLLDGKDKPSGWVLSFDRQNGAFRHGNLLRKGEYRASRFKETNYTANTWNRIRVSRCPDGTARLAVNGVEVAQEFKPVQASSPLYFRATGLDVDLAAAHKF